MANCRWSLTHLKDRTSWERFKHSRSAGSSLSLHKVTTLKGMVAKFYSGTGFLLIKDMVSELSDYTSYLQLLFYYIFVYFMYYFLYASVKMSCILVSIKD